MSLLDLSANLSTEWLCEVEPKISRHVAKVGPAPLKMAAIRRIRKARNCQHAGANTVPSFQTKVELAALRDKTLAKLAAREHQWLLEQKRPISQRGRQQRVNN